MYRKYTAAGNVSAVKMTTTDSRAEPCNGYISHILITGDDASADVTIADAIGNVFAKTGIATNTSGGVHYKHDNADILRNHITGQLTVTVANNAGTVNIYVFFKPFAGN